MIKLHPLQLVEYHLKGLAKSQNFSGAKNASYGLWDVTNGHMGTQLMELNEIISWIFKIKRILKMFENHVQQTTY